MDGTKASVSEGKQLWIPLHLPGCTFINCAEEEEEDESRSEEYNVEIGVLGGSGSDSTPHNLCRLDWRMSCHIVISSPAKPKLSL